MQMTSENRLFLMCRRNGFNSPVEERLEFGYRRFRIDTRSYEETSAVRYLLSRSRDFSIVRVWKCSGGGFFEGCVYVMETKDYTEYTSKMDEKMAQIEDWWQRYHVADEETRRLMACGAIA